MNYARFLRLRSAIWDDFERRLEAAQGEPATLAHADLEAVARLYRQVLHDHALAASRFGAPLLVGNAANILAERWPKDVGQPVKVEQQAAPDIDWVAWLAAAVDPDVARPRPFYLRAPDAKPPADQLPRAEATQPT